MRNYIPASVQQKKIVSKLKRPPTEWEKIFACYTSDKGLITRIHRELKKLNSLKINEPSLSMMPFLMVVRSFASKSQMQV
jgi:hypothetical protein